MLWRRQRDYGEQLCIDLTVRDSRIIVGALDVNWVMDKLESPLTRREE